MITDKPHIPFRWGILGAGYIASKFIEELQKSNRHTVAAIASSNLSRAKDYGNKYRIPGIYGAYSELTSMEKLDGIYIATHNSLHCDTSILALRDGHAVLCEKPFALNFAEAYSMVDVAKEMNALLVEAMWTRFLPHVRKIRDIVYSGLIGSVVELVANNGRAFAQSNDFRLFRHEVGGGALLDSGIYLLALNSLLFGEPDFLKIRTEYGTGKVDLSSTLVFNYKSGETSTLNTSIIQDLDNFATIRGTHGIIEIDAPFYRPTTFRVINFKDETVTLYGNDVETRGLIFEADEFLRCKSLGLIESPDMPLHETLEIMRTMDRIRSGG